MQPTTLDEPSGIKMDEAPTIPTPQPEHDVPIGVCGYPVDRTGSDWPGERSTTYDEEVPL